MDVLILMTDIDGNLGLIRVRAIRPKSAVLNWKSVMFFNEESIPQVTEHLSDFSTVRFLMFLLLI